MTATTPPRGPARRALRAFAYRFFYGLPPRLRRVIVRIGVGSYTVGAVVLATRVPAGGAESPQANGPGDAGGPRMIGQPDAPATGHLLMVRQPPGQGWSLPAGLLARGERPVACAARELREETAVAIEAEALLPATPNAVVHTRGRWIDMVFTTAVPAETALATDGQEILEAAWHPIEALPPVTPATGRLLAHYGIGPYAAYPEVTR
jgi:ADP-ribose pyrophosphatase YjhB (NUDIX family)